MSFFMLVSLYLHYVKNYTIIAESNAHFSKAKTVILLSVSMQIKLSPYN